MWTVMFCFAGLHKREMQSLYYANKCWHANCEGCGKPMLRIKGKWGLDRRLAKE